MIPVRAVYFLELLGFLSYEVVSVAWRESCLVAKIAGCSVFLTNISCDNLGGHWKQSGPSKAHENHARRSPGS